MSDHTKQSQSRKESLAGVDILLETSARDSSSLGLENLTNLNWAFSLKEEEIANMKKKKEI